MGKGRKIRGKLSAHRPPPRQAVDVWFWCPAYDGVPVQLWDSLGVLCISNANAVMLDSIRAHPPDGKTSVGIFAADPFYPAQQLLRRLQAAGIKRVCNLPSVGAIDGDTAATLTEVGLGFRSEIECLAELRHGGIETTIFVHNLDSVLAALDAGCTELVLHPGPPDIPSAQAVGNKASTEELIVSAHARGATILLYRGADSRSLPKELQNAFDGFIDQYPG